MITIEYCTKEDTEELFILFGEWDNTYVFDRGVFVDSMNRILDERSNILLLAKEDGKIVGYVQMYPCNELGFEPFFEVAEFLVAGEKRNRGIGKLLMKEAEGIALSEKIRIIKLSSQAHRTKAHVFYENMGYEYYKISKFYEKKLMKETE